MEEKDVIIVYDSKVKEFSEEVDFFLYVDILGKDRNEDVFGREHFYKGIDFPNTPIKIEELKKHIQRIEESGCNYVSIDYHCDHNEYEFYGVDVHEANDDEVIEFDEKEKSELLSKTSKLREAAKKYIEEAEKIEKKINK